MTYQTSTQARELRLLNKYGYWNQPWDAMQVIYQEECQSMGERCSQIFTFDKCYWPCEGEGVKGDQNVIIELPKI